MLLYLVHVPYASYRYRWLARHPSAWDVPPRQRRVIRRTARSMRRLGLRPPLRRRVAGAAAGAAARAGAVVRRRRSAEINGLMTGENRPRRIGLRRHP
jgi:CDP-diacylglycerol--serine O-phosphatidyltransferase